MANINIQVYQCFIYLISFILANTFFIPIILNVSEFQGKCLLFTTGTFNESDGRVFEPKWSNFSYCGLTIFNGVFLNIASIMQLYQMFYLISKGKKGSIISTFWDAVIAFFAVIFLLINSFIVTFGFIKWCNSLSQNFESCEDAADSNVLIISKTDIKPESFYLQMGIVQFGVWSSLVSWFVSFVISGFSFYEYHQRENLMISMARQRKRYQTIEDD